MLQAEHPSLQHLAEQHSHSCHPMRSEPRRYPLTMCPTPGLSWQEPPLTGRTEIEKPQCVNSGNHADITTRVLLRLQADCYQSSFYHAKVSLPYTTSRLRRNRCLIKYKGKAFLVLEHPRKV